MKDGHEFIVVEHINYVSPDVCRHWPLALGGEDTVYRIEISGRPQLRCEIDLDVVPEIGMDSGLVATAMRAINAIPWIVDARTRGARPDGRPGAPDPEPAPRRWEGARRGAVPRRAGLMDAMVQIESAWGKYPGYEINLRRDARGRAASATATCCWPRATTCLRLEETKHVDRLYFPVEDVRWEHFDADRAPSVCPFKGEADYWSLTAVDPVEHDIVWSYSNPFEEVGGIEGYVAFYHERVRIEVEERWPGGSRGSRRTGSRRGATPPISCASSTSSPTATEPLRRPAVPRHDAQRGRRRAAPRAGDRRRVEGAAAPAGDVGVDVSSRRRRRSTRRSTWQSRSSAKGRTFSTAEVRISQADALRSAGLFLLDAGAPDVFRGQVPMPDVPGPDDSGRSTCA